MPMLDAYIPADALPAEAEQALIAKLTDLLLEHEGADPRNERARSIAWVFVHRPEVYVAGAPAQAPHYRFVCQVPEGQYDEPRRAAATAAITQAVADAEAGAYPHPELRVWVFTYEVPDGTWGGAGRVVHLPDIYEFAGAPRGAAEAVLANRRREHAQALLDAASAPVPV